VLGHFLYTLTLKGVATLGQLCWARDKQPQTVLAHCARCTTGCVQDPGLDSTMAASF
jgi:hypothetical protein